MIQYIFCNISCPTENNILCQLDMLFKHVYDVEVEYNHEWACVWYHLILCLPETVDSKYVYIGINRVIEHIYWSFNNWEETVLWFISLTTTYFSINFCLI